MKHNRPQCACGQTRLTTKTEARAGKALDPPAEATIDGRSDGGAKSPLRPEAVEEFLSDGAANFRLARRCIVDEAAQSRVDRRARPSRNPLVRPANDDGACARAFRFFCRGSRSPRRRAAPF
jgi:hypothetical protein